MDQRRVASVRVEYVCHGFGRIQLRRFDIKRDSYVSMTALLHRAFASLGSAGLNCECASQTIATTRRRAAEGDCLVAVCGTKIVGTMTLCTPDPNSPCEWYRHHDVASLHQLGIDPEWQRRGIGTLMLAFADHWAATRGYAQLALQTPQQASHLVAFYRSQGFRIIDTMRFEPRSYDSVILTRAPVAQRTLANWATRLEPLPRLLQRAA
ncbi:GNAT family N-acetyltransferase [Paraburkholderia caledonica]|uniref:GNAT superfamily N-acetyltransferase n=1 Tax=Paraburkholderia caledonica TaxID=134536 RepID=A0AB73II62_9BURK|nr:GNAT family N-acetyltransferase [Paraburkholderia caledonica]MDP9647822.1 GNAT superfamily N-acetyltransferase [Paraburkholderia caledonica]